MKYKLTRHAQDVVAEREIPIEWVERVLTSPQRIQADAADAELEHRLGRIAEHGNRVLRVVLNRRISPVRVVTVYFDRTQRNEL